MERAVFDVAIAFFHDLEQDNTRDFWGRERHRYDDLVRPVFVEVCTALTAFSAWRVYRPHNDLRFRPDAPPYKTFIGAVAERPDGVGAFLQVGSLGLLVATGIPMPAPDQLARFRAAVEDDTSGAELLAGITEVQRRGLVVGPGRTPPLKRVPRGIRSDHPRAHLLTWKGMAVDRRVARPAWTHVDEAASGIDALLLEPRELHAWLGRHVGRSALSAEERFAPRKRGRPQPSM